MTPPERLDLDAIERRHPDSKYVQSRSSTADVRALVAEVRSLRSALKAMRGWADDMLDGPQRAAVLNHCDQALGVFNTSMSDLGAAAVEGESPP